MCLLFSLGSSTKTQQVSITVPAGIGLSAKTPRPLGVFETIFRSPKRLKTTESSPVPVVIVMARDFLYQWNFAVCNLSSRKEEARGEVEWVILFLCCDLHMSLQGHCILPQP